MNNSAPAPPHRQIRAYPHYPRSFQLFQACRLCVKSTGICSRLTVQMTFLSPRGSDEAAQIP
jgi:hypothetical protein